MPLSRDEVQQATIDRLTARLTRREAELRRVYDELDWRDEKIRVLTRLIERLSKGDPHG